MKKPRFHGKRCKACGNDRGGKMFLARYDRTEYRGKLRYECTHCPATVAVDVEASGY